VVLVSLLVVGGVSYGAIRFFASADDVAIRYVPEDAFAYASVFLEPSTAQRRALRDLLERTSLRSAEDAEAALGELLDGPLGRIGLGFERDVQPWLGGQAAVFLTAPGSGRDAPGWGLLLATEDEDATRRSLQRYRSEAAVGSRAISYKDVSAELLADGTVTGFLESFLFIGSRDAFEAAVDAGDGRSLSDSARYRRALDDLPTDRLAVAYLDTGTLMNAFTGGFGFLPVTVLGGMFDQTSAAVLFASPDGLVIDGSSRLLERSLFGDLGLFVGKPGMMANLPSEAWLALNLPELSEVSRSIFGSLAPLLLGAAGPAAEEAFLQETGIDLERDVFGWMGDGGFFTEGFGPSAGGGFVVSATNEAASRRAVHRLAGIGIARGIQVAPRHEPGLGSGEAGRIGYVAELEGDRVHLAADNGRVFAGIGERALSMALDPSSRLADRPRWRGAVDSLGTKHVPLLFINVGAMRASQAGPGAPSAFSERLEPWIESLTYVISGARRADGRVWTRTVMGVE
jgi:hypothetical protein